MSNDREKIATKLFEDGKKHFVEDNTAVSAVIFKELLDDYSDICNIPGLNYWLGISYFAQDDLDLALNHLCIAYDNLDRKKYGLNIMMILYRLGDIYFDYNDYEKSIRYLDEAEDFYKYYEAEGWQEELYEFRKLKGNVHHWLSEVKKAIEEYLKAEKYIIKNEDEAQIKHVQLNFLISKTYIYDDKIENGEKYLHKVDTKFLNVDDHCEYYFLLMRLYLYYSEFQKLIDSYIQTLKLGVPEAIGAEIYNFAGKAYFNLGDGINAKKCFVLSQDQPYHRDWLEESNKSFLLKLKNNGYW